MKKSTLPKFKNIAESLKYHQIEKIKSFDELNQYFDLKNLDEDNTPKICATKNVCLIIDNENFNETYLIDLVNQLIDEFPKLKEDVIFRYIDKFEIKKELIAPSSTDDKVRATFEKVELTPRFIIINPGKEEISEFKETFIPFTYDLLKLIFKQTELLNG